MYWHYYLIWLAITSGIVFLLYGYDKAQSRNGGWRVPEIVFHGLSLAGGFAGGWAGRAVFRHKTKKVFFLFVLTLTTMLHLGFLYWLIFV